MDTVIDQVKGMAKSSQDFVGAFFHHRHNSSRRNPIEILKRLQQEAFSDLMKLRDRQDKVERALSFYKTSKGTPFQEASTHVKGEVDVLGGIIMRGNLGEQHNDAVGSAGIQTGVNSKITFETTIRQKDALVAEFVACQSRGRNSGDFSGGALTLAKVFYMANINDWLSATAIPVGAQFRDLGTTVNCSNQKHGLTDLSLVAPPLMNQHNDAAFGLAARLSNVVASLAQSVSIIERQPSSDRIVHCLSTFGQLVYQFPRGVKLSLIGLQKVHKSSNSNLNFGTLAIPMSFLKGQRTSGLDGESSVPVVVTNTHQNVSTGNIALKLESELDDSARIGGWIEMSSDAKHLHWGVNAFDDSEDEIGWGLNVSGLLEGPNNWSRLQAEAYLKLNFAKNFILKPGISYAVDDNARVCGLMLRSNWSF